MTIDDLKWTKARLIDHDALMKAFEREVALMFGETVTIKAIRRFLAGRPTVEAKPVTRGEWQDLCRGKVRVCSCCKNHFDNTCNEIDDEWKFCPSCGARMEGDKDDG